MTTLFDLEALLRRAGLSQSELARRSGVSLRTINRLCRNATATVALETLDALATALEVPPGAMLIRVKGKRRPASA